MWHQRIDPFDSVGLSAAAAALPLVILFALLVSKKLAGHLAAVATLAVGLLTAMLAFGMPARLAFLSALFGVMNGLFPIGWIVVAAVFLYDLSVKNGSFAIVCKSTESITPDRRLQVLLIAFCFGAFLEGAAGFGAPVAITTGMLVGLGFQPLRAAILCLIANSAPVAFGSIGIPVLTAAQTSGIDASAIGRMVVHQLPVLSLIVPLWLVILLAGWSEALAIWPAILVTGASYTLTMYVVAMWLGPALPNILAAIVSLFSLVLFLRVWRPKTIWRFPGEGHHVARPDAVRIPAGDQVRGWTLFLLIVLFVSNWGVAGIKAALDQVTMKLPMTGLDQAIFPGAKSIPVVYTFNWLSAAGTAIFLAAIVGAALQRMPVRMVAQTLRETMGRLLRPLITIGSIVGFAYLANYSGMSMALGRALTATGQLFPLLAPVVGWLGAFASGSDTASNALFSNMQHAAATQLGLNPLLTISANTVGGVTAKMISPQSIAVAAASSKLVGQEGQIFRRALPHSLGMLGIVCVLTYMQAYHWQSMVVRMVSSAGQASKSAAVQIGPEGLAVLGLSVVALALLARLNLSAPLAQSAPASSKRLQRKRKHRNRR